MSTPKPISDSVSFKPPIKKMSTQLFIISSGLITTILFITYDILIDVIPLLVSDVTLLTELFILIFFKYYYKSKQKTMIVVKSSIV